MAKDKITKRYEKEQDRSAQRDQAIKGMIRSVMGKRG
jgi:hypothetical protein